MRTFEISIPIPKATVATMTFKRPLLNSCCASSRSCTQLPTVSRTATRNGGANRACARFDCKSVVVVIEKRPATLWFSIELGARRGNTYLVWTHQVIQYQPCYACSHCYKQYLHAAPCMVAGTRESMGTQEAGKFICLCLEGGVNDHGDCWRGD